MSIKFGEENSATIPARATAVTQVLKGALEAVVAANPENKDAEPKNPDSPKKVYEYQDGHSDALVIHCSSPHFQKAFREFLENELGIKAPAVIAIPGSTGSFGVQSYLPKPWHSLQRQVEVLVEKDDFPRLILINHDDCSGYAKVANFLGGLSKIGIMQKYHLKGLADYLLKTYLPNTKVELYQAKVVQRDGKSGVVFERVL